MPVSIIAVPFRQLPKIAQYIHPHGLVSPSLPTMYRPLVNYDRSGGISAPTRPGLYSPSHPLIQQRFICQHYRLNGSGHHACAKIHSASLVTYGSEVRACGDQLVHHLLHTH